MNNLRGICPSYYAHIDWVYSFRRDARIKGSLSNSPLSVDIAYRYHDGGSFLLKKEY